MKRVRERLLETQIIAVDSVGFALNVERHFLGPGRLVTPFETGVKVSKLELVESS